MISAASIWTAKNSIGIKHLMRKTSVVQHQEGKPKEKEGQDLRKSKYNLCHPGNLSFEIETTKAIHT